MAKSKSIQDSGPAETSARSAIFLPFVAREREISRLCQLHAEHKHVLILGPAGVGKSALMEQVRERLTLLVSPKSVHFGEIFTSLEPELRLDGEGVTLLQRKRQLRAALRECGGVVVFDGVDWTGPKVSSFFESVAERTPVWICTRSDHPWDIGHLWPLLARYARVELSPFHLAETQALVEAAVQPGVIPPPTRHIVGWLQRRSAGSPLVLRELFQELSTGRYALSSPLALRRLDLDRRIHEVFPAASVAPISPGAKLVIVPPKRG